MSKRHDENKDIRLVSRVAKVNVYEKTIQAPKSSLIGIRTWGRIDFLTHYCGYVFLWNNSIQINKSIHSDSSSIKKNREYKKSMKENLMNSKNKRNNGKKE